MQKILGLALAGALSASALAADWNEVGDAGQSIAAAQITNGVNPLANINGALSLELEDFVDIYCIRIPDPSGFGATTVGHAGFDTQLFLFDANGMGITFNDDASPSTTRSTITGTFITSPGIYFLAVSMWDRDPFTAANQEIWNDTPFTSQRAPDGPGAGSPLDHWAGQPQTGDGAYTIEMRGADFHVPEPVSAVLLALGALAIRRR